LFQKNKIKCIYDGGLFHVGSNNIGLILIFFDILGQAFLSFDLD
jgi:hypothetical protein